MQLSGKLVCKYKNQGKEKTILPVMMKSIIVTLLLFAFLPARPQAGDAFSTCTVYFASGSSVVSGSEMEKLRKEISGLQMPETITIKGFTDSVGSIRYNQRLSENRANAVAALLNKSFAGSRLQVLFYGEDSPASETELGQNRRVEITFPKLKENPPTVGMDTVAVIPPQPDTTTKGKPVAIPLQTDTATKGKRVEYTALEKIYFVPDMAVIEQFSLPYVKKLATLLRRYPATTFFEIRGHVNCPEKNCQDTNYKKYVGKLSENRAAAVYNRLIQLGISAERMRYRGMSNSEMVFPEPKDEMEKRKNMRVEVIVFNGE